MQHDDERQSEKGEKKNDKPFPSLDNSIYLFFKLFILKLLSTTTFYDSKPTE